MISQLRVPTNPSLCPFRCFSRVFDPRQQFRRRHRRRHYRRRRRPLLARDGWIQGEGAWPPPLELERCPSVPLLCCRYWLSIFNVSITVAAVRRWLRTRTALFFNRITRAQGDGGQPQNWSNYRVQEEEEGKGVSSSPSYWISRTVFE